MIKLKDYKDGWWQLNVDKVCLVIYSYEYDAHPDYTWLALNTGGRYPVEIKGQLAAEIYLKLAAAGVKGKLFKEKKYVYKGGL